MVLDDAGKYAALEVAYESHCGRTPGKLIGAASVSHVKFFILFYHLQKCCMIYPKAPSIFNLIFMALDRA